MTQKYPRAIQFPFSFTPQGKIKECTSYPDVVRGQIIDALMTNSGERVYRPRYGCDIQSMVFDPSQELERIDAASMIQTRLTQMVPRANIVSVELRHEQSSVYIDVKYRSSPYTPANTVTVPINNEFVQRQLTQGITEIT